MVALYMKKRKRNQHNNLITIFCTHDHMLIQFKILISKEKHHNCDQSIEEILTFKRTAVVDKIVYQFMPKSSSAPFFKEIKRHQ